MSENSNPFDSNSPSKYFFPKMSVSQ